MAYIGNQPTIGQYRKLDDISGSFNGSLTAFTMQVGSTNVSAGSVFQLLISLGGVIQNPGTDFTVSGSTLTFTTAPTSGLDFFGILMGQPLNTATPGDSTVTGAKIVDGTITGAKLAAGFNYDSGLLFLDDTNNRVGIGTTNPSSALHIDVASGEPLRFRSQTSGSNYFAHANHSAGDLAYVGAGGGAALNSGTTSDYAIRANQGALLFGTNGNNERARIDSSGRLLVGTTTAQGSNFLQLEGSTSGDTEWSGISLRRGIATASLVNNQYLGVISFQSQGGAEGGVIRAICDANWSASSHPTRLTFETTASSSTSPTERFRIRNNGEVVVFNSPTFYPNTDNAVVLGFTGNRWSAVWAANGTIQTSDQRTKTDIADAQIGTDFIKALRPVSYKWIEGGKRDTGERDEDGNYIYESVPGQRTHWGFIAQEVKQAGDDAGVDFGGWVLTDKDDPDSEQALRYDQFIAPLTKALQEALTRIETLETTNASLEARLTALEGA